MTYDANNKISNLVDSQLPGFIRDYNPLFGDFLQAYYEYMEQSNNAVVLGKTVDRANQLLNYQDIDTTIDLFSQHLYDEFMALFPQNMLANKAIVLKNIKQFYRAKGTQKSYRFLFRALYGEEIDFVLPKDQILRASAGKWFIEQSIRVSSVTVNGISENNLAGLQFFVNTKIKGQTSAATAFVERVLVSQQNGVQVFEVFLSHQQGSFSQGETITSTDVNGNSLIAMLVSGTVVDINIIDGGTLYNVGDPALIQGGGGMGASAYVSQVSPGDVNEVIVLQGGAGFRVGDLIQFISSSGSGANANVSALAGTANSFYHPNTYIINVDQVGTYQNVFFNAASYGFAGLATANANTPLINSYTTFSYGLTGPMLTVLVFASGNNYLTAPFADVFGNTLVKQLSVCGRLQINSPGDNYAAGENIVINNPTLCFGQGANAQIVSVNATGAIELCQFQPVYGHYTGGEGFNPTTLPYQTTIETANGVGGNVTVTALLAYGSPETSLFVQTGSIGVIEEITLSSGGVSFTSPPTVNLKTTGDGTAQATANIVTGTYTYPGYYLDDTGFPSGSNALESQDYYQNYSYVIKVKQSINQYRQYVKNLVHPAGTKLWGQYQLLEPNLASTIVVNDEVYRADLNFPVNAVSFSTTGTYLSRNSAFTGIQNGKTGTVSLWVEIDSEPTPTGGQILFLGNTTSFSLFQVQINNTGTTNAASDYVSITGKDSGGNTILNLTSNTSASFEAGQWVHILSSWDLTNSQNCSIYLTNVLSTNTVGVVNSNLAYNCANAFVYTQAGGAIQYSRCLSEVWFDTSYTNLANALNRQLFITPGLLPANLNTNGSFPTGTSPVLYLRNNANTFGINSGTGGNLIANGILLTCNSSPNIA